MSARLRRLSGGQVLMILSRLGFGVVSQRGDHVKLRRIGPRGERQTIVVPKHDELDLGTLRAIVRQVSRYVSEEDLRRFYHPQ